MSLGEPVILNFIVLYSSRFSTWSVPPSRDFLYESFLFLALPSVQVAGLHLGGHVVAVFTAS